MLHMQTFSETYHVPVGSSQFLAQQAHGNAQFWSSILKILNVVEVFGQTEVSKYGFLQSQAHAIHDIVDTNCRDLVMYIATERLEPVHCRFLLLENTDEMCWL